MGATNSSQPFAEYSFDADAEYLRRFTEDVYGVSRSVVDTSRLLRRRARWNALIAFCGIAMCVVVLVLIVEGTMDESRFFVWGLIPGGIGASGLYGWQQCRLALQKLGQAVISASDAHIEQLVGRWRISFSDEGILCQGPRVDSMWKWPNFSRVDVHPSAVAMVCPQGVVAVPRMCFADEESLQALVAQVRERLERHGATEPQRMRDYLLANSIACRKCGYDLKGSAGQACPECGEPLTIGDVPDAAKTWPTPPQS